MSKHASSEREHELWPEVALARARGEGDGTLPEQIAGRIAELIEGGRLDAGERLPSERELARIFGVSRLAVREAAHRLEAQGLVAVRRGAGAFVAEHPARQREEARAVPALDLDELAAVRMLLEPAAAEWAARRRGGASLRVLHRVAEQFEQAAAAEPRFDLAAAADVEFHLEVARCADNALLVRLIGQLLDLNRLRLEWTLRRRDRLRLTAAEHLSVLEAIAAGDAVAARAAMEAHLASSAASLQALGDAEALVD